MNATELQIGDWVMYNPNVFIEDEYETTKECYPTKIENGNDIDLAEKGCYTPIPLTSEILELNGWEYGDWGNEYENDECYFTNETIGFDLHINDKEEFEIRSVDAVNITLKFVHELQHALRLCGIEKNIEL